MKKLLVVLLLIFTGQALEAQNTSEERCGHVRGYL